MTVFGDAFLLKTPELVNFYKDRNLIAHDYLRIFHAEIKGVKKRHDQREFLKEFISKAIEWRSILNGLLSELRLATATKQKRENEVELTDQQRIDLEKYRIHAAKYLIHKKSGP